MAYDTTVRFIKISDRFAIEIHKIAALSGNDEINKLWVITVGGDEYPVAEEYQPDVFRFWELHAYDEREETRYDT